MRRGPSPGYGGYESYGGYEGCAAFLGLSLEGGSLGCGVKADIPTFVSSVHAFPPCRYLVLVSDGVSQFMDSDEIIGLVHYLVTKHRCKPSKVRWGLGVEGNRTKQGQKKKRLEQFFWARSDWWLLISLPAASLCP